MSSSELTITDRDFEYFGTLLMKLCGLYLKPSRRDLLQSRLMPRLEALGLNSFSAYREYLQKLPENHDEWQALVNLMTTNKTDFFREAAHFKYLLEDFLPEWELRAHGRKLRVWCAASSSGEEAYTLSMTLDRHFRGADRFEIIASDIDTDTLELARNGVYPVSRLSDIPISYRERSVALGQAELSDWFKIRDVIKSRVIFKTRNLIEFPFEEMGRFDLIFCRNVFIYFTPETIEKIVRHFHAVALPGAALAIGHSETLPREPWVPAGLPALFLREARAVESPSPAKKSRHSSGPVPPSTSVSVPPNITQPCSRNRKIRVLIVDDSKTIRELLRQSICASEDFDVVGAASSAEEADAMIPKLKPDVMTLDIHMPGMDGVTYLERRQVAKKLPVVMISSVSREDGDPVLRALELGAIDYIKKPTMTELESLAPLIREKLRAAASARLQPTERLSRRNQAVSGNFAQISLIAMGASTGGTEALKDVLTRLPSSIPPILIVQHIPPVFSAAFAQRLDSLCPFEVKEAGHGDEVRAGRVLISPGGRHMRIENSGTGFVVRLSDEQPVNRHRPSVDVLFDSVARLVGRKAVGVLLTGMGTDGAKGLLNMRNAGARTLAQNEESCVVFGMPKEAQRIGAAQEVCALDEIAEKIARDSRRSLPNAS